MLNWNNLVRHFFLLRGRLTPKNSTDSKTVIYGWSLHSAIASTIDIVTPGPFSIRCFKCLQIWLERWTLIEMAQIMNLYVINLSVKNLTKEGRNSVSAHSFCECEYLTVQNLKKPKVNVHPFRPALKGIQSICNSFGKLFH